MPPIKVEEMNFEKVRDLFLKVFRAKKYDKAFCRKDIDASGAYRIMGFNEGDNVTHVFSFDEVAGDVWECAYSYKGGFLSKINYKSFKANKTELLALYNEVERLNNHS